MRLFAYYNLAIVPADDAEKAAVMLEHTLQAEVDPHDLVEVDQTSAEVLLLEAA